MTTVLPAAVLWDMDGTIVNTEPAWVRAEKRLLHEWGAAMLPSDVSDWVGIGLWDLAVVFQERGVELSTDEIVGRLTTMVNDEIFTRSLDWMPGARELLADVRRHGMVNVLVTMATRRQALEVISQLPQDTFAGVIAGDDVQRPKPDPEAYERGAALVRTDASRCIAIEDSVTGATAAVRSGAIVAAVPNPLDVFTVQVDARFSTLEGVSAQDLVTLFQTKGHH